MKHLLTGAARPVTDTNERIRRLFENRPFLSSAQPERRSRPRKAFAKAAEDEGEQNGIALEGDAPELEVPELDALEDAEPISAEDETEEV